MGPGSDAVLEKLTDASERWLGKFSPRVQAQIIIGAGMFVTAVDWVLLSTVPSLASAAEGPVEGGVILVLVSGPSLLVYGLLRAFVPTVSAPPTGAQFGSLLVQAEAEQRWKHRLLAIGAGVVHAMVCMGMMS